MILSLFWYCFDIISQNNKYKNKYIWESFLSNRIIFPCSFIEWKRRLCNNSFFFAFYDFLYCTYLVDRNGEVVWKGKFCKSETHREDKISGKTIMNQESVGSLTRSCKIFFNYFSGKMRENLTYWKKKWRNIVTTRKQLFSFVKILLIKIKNLHFNITKNFFLLLLSVLKNIIFVPWKNFLRDSPLIFEFLF